MTQSRRAHEFDKRLCEGHETESSRFSVASHRTIAAVEGTIARVLARLPSGCRKRLLVAVSGGPDSVAALHAFHRIRAHSGVEIAAAHLNHGIRGPESDRDEHFVRELCSRLELELIIERAHGLKPVNLEERAREVRYEFLNRAADSLDAQFIVLGHHKNDQAETVLLRLLRGTGVAGLAAMSEFGPGRLLRPLLSLKRETILAYLEAIGAKYLTDSSNREERALRNRVRARLLPHLEHDYSPRITDRLAELASEMSQLDLFISTEAGRSLDRLLLPTSDPSQASSHRLDLRGFESLSPALAHAIMRKLIERAVGDLRRIKRAHIDAMCRLAVGGRPSATIILPGAWRFRREYNAAVLERPEPLGNRARSIADDGELSLTPGVNRLSGGSNLMLREIGPQDPSFPTSLWLTPSPFEAYFDAASAPAFSARYWRAGDRIRPLGLDGSRKIQDVFVDNKVRAASRKSWPLVISGNEVVWIPGLVRSGAALVTPQSRKVVHLRADSVPDAQNFDCLNFNTRATLY
jgi:tRNA(Ile)-lysidine synthase